EPVLREAGPRAPPADVPPRVLDRPARRALLPVEAQVLALLPVHHRQSGERLERLALDQPPELEELPVLEERPAGGELGPDAGAAIPSGDPVRRLEEER